MRAIKKEFRLMGRECVFNIGQRILFNRQERPAPADKNLVELFVSTCLLQSETECFNQFRKLSVFKILDMLQTKTTYTVRAYCGTCPWYSMNGRAADQKLDLHSGPPASGPGQAEQAESQQAAC